MREHEQALDFVPGMPVIWVHQLRGGYGYLEWVPAEVIAVRAQRVLIAVRTGRGDVVQTMVRPESLRVLGAEE